jgi:hypothetical protein
VPVAGVAVGVAVLQVIDSACCLTLYFHSWLSNIMQEIMNGSFIIPANFVENIFNCRVSVVSLRLYI